MLYHDEPPGKPGISRTEAARELATISRERGVIFVAGLLDPPYNSAHWIDCDGGRLMCHKKCDDFSGTYVPCEVDCDYANPVSLEGVCTGGLICNEIQSHARGLAARIDAEIICIPGCMSDVWFGPGPFVPDYWSGKYVVVANSNPDGCGSFIANTKGERKIFSERRNKLILQTWEETDRLLCP